MDTRFSVEAEKKSRTLNVDGMEHWFTTRDRWAEWLGHIC